MSFAVLAIVIVGLAGVIPIIASRWEIQDTERGQVRLGSLGQMLFILLWGVLLLFVGLLVVSRTWPG